jgi:tripartite-type tricarboxylate transporter receptor subunit TctC
MVPKKPDLNKKEDPLQLLRTLIRAIAGAALSLATAAQAQDFPTGPVTLIVPGSAGSASDIVGRIIADGMSKTLGQPVVVEDLPEGAGTVAGAKAAEAKPDGYTVLLMNTSITAAESLHPQRGYVFMEDLAPIGSFASSFFVYVVNPKVEAKTFDEFVKLAKEKPGEINYSAAAVGTATYLATEILKSKVGLDLMHIPYNGGAPALAAVVSGETQFSAAPFASVKPLIEAGEVRPLAVSSLERAPELPDVPAVSETVPGFDTGSFYGLAVPAGTPPDVVERLYKGLADAVNGDETGKRLADQGLRASLADSAAFGAFLKDSIATIAKIAKDNNLSAQ